MAENDEITIDKDTFHQRLSTFQAQWKNDKRSGDALFGGTSSMIICMGKTADELNYEKNSAFQFWLFGYEFPTTLMILTTEKAYVVTTKKKATYLEALVGGRVPLELLIRGGKGAEEENKKIFDRCLEIIKEAGPKVGVLPNLDGIGTFTEEWHKSLDTISDDIEKVDVSAALSIAAMGIKDEKELRLVREASRASSGLLRKYFVDQMLEIFDQDKRITNSTISKQVNNKIDDAQFLQSLKVSGSFDPTNVDWAYPPVVYSGGFYDLKLSADADDKNLHAGVIVAAMGVRYFTYSSLVGRSYLVDPNKSQESHYKILLAAHEAALKKIKDGVVAKAVYEEALSVVRTKKKDLESHFVKSIGFGIGLESRDSVLNLNAKNSRVLKDGMTLVVTTGFNDLQNPEPQNKRSSTYSLMLSDTVRVTPDEIVIFTKDAPTDPEFTSFFFRDDEEEQKPAQSRPKKDSRVGAVAATNITKTRLRAERTTNQDAEKDAARRKSQKDLHGKKQREGLEKYKKDIGALNGVEEKKFKRFESYKRDNQFPPRVKDLVICVDQKNNSIVLPIMGRPVPFHINTVKNASRTDEGEFTYLRINFLSPGQGVGRKDDQPFEDPSAHFVRSLTFRSKDFDRISDISEQISELKKSSVKREQEKKEMEDVVEQGKLEVRQGVKRGRLEPVFLRPGLEGKRLAGSVEIAVNGLRYQHPTGQDVDILFNNIQHLFFQPCDHELIVLIHVHLVNPIMIGKRKTKDVQFYKEATEMAFDETGNRKRKHRYGDEEEFEAEQEERRRRAAINREFKAFAERIADAGKAEDLSVDIPFRELGFSGVPARSNVLVQPTTDCLVQLTEPPFLVVTLNDIEWVHLERVQYGLKNFDMVMIMQDFNKSPTHVNTIPVENLDAVKDWLDSVGIPFSEGPLNLNWTQIMKTIQADPHTFFKDGGWSFLDTDSDDENAASEESEAESNFEMSDSEVAGLSGESSEDDSEFDEDASADASEGDDASLAESEEGEDWDELEKKAKKKDQESGLDVEERGKKKRR